MIFKHYCAQIDGLAVTTNTGQKNDISVISYAYEVRRPWNMFLRLSSSMKFTVEGSSSSAAPGNEGCRVAGCRFCPLTVTRHDRS